MLDLTPILQRIIKIKPFGSIPQDVADLQADALDLCEEVMALRIALQSIAEIRKKTSTRLDSTLKQWENILPKDPN
jgi:hypothetical protein